MENLKSMTTAITERLRSPFFFSFIISWLFCNWRIPIALCFYDTHDLYLEGYYTYNAFIQSKLNPTNSLLFWLPFIMAAVYTFIYPMFRNVVSRFNAWNLKWGNDWDLKVGRKTQVSLEKFLVLRDKVKRQEAELERIIKDENKTELENQDLHVKLQDAANEIDEKIKMVDEARRESSSLKLENHELISLNKAYKDENAVLDAKTIEYDSLKSEFELLKKNTDISLLQGEWFLHEFNNNDEEESKVIITFFKSTFNIKDTNESAPYERGHIKFYYFDKSKKKIILILEQESILHKSDYTHDSLVYYHLEYINESLFRGTNSEHKKVTFNNTDPNKIPF